MQEQLFGVLCAALDASFLPLLEKQRELEARLERLHQAEQRAATPAVATAAAPSFTPAPAQASPKILPLETTQAGPRSVAPRASLIPTSYGFVIEPEAAARRPSIEVALENVGPIDVPDFGRSRRAAGNVLVALLLAGVVAAIAATILSYT